MDVSTIVATARAADLESIEKLAEEYGVNVALRGVTPQAAAALLEKRGARIGATVDVEDWRRRGLKMAEGVKAIGKRLMVVSVVGIEEPALKEVVEEAYRLEIKPVLWALREQAVDTFARVALPVARYHAEYASRTPGVRREGGISDEERALVEKAIPASAPATPKKPRRLLVMDLNIGRRGHPSIPHANLAIELMGKRTGAFEAVHSNDLSMLKAENLRKFDAIYLNNTIGNLFETAELRDSLAAFLNAGGGLLGHHAVTVTSTEWPEFGEILGARGASHRMADEKVMVQVEDTASPLTKVFAGQSFEFVDEIFRFQPPYSREKVRVLLSIDLSKTDMNQGRCFGRCFRDDNDYPIAWIRRQGKGRVFYTTVGHNPFVFWNPKMLSFFLAGIQFALGDLEADATPGSR